MGPTTSTKTILNSLTVDDPLLSYKSKRDFSRTPEPKDPGRPSVNHLTFVVQKHWASKLHYDFRLEMGGTMKSWAIPKGPSLDPTVKRMAVQVEDHPLSYASFEGTVPPKLYGAGKVIVWDQGAWSPLHEPVQGYREGQLKFELHGVKLHGKWVLVRMKGNGEKQAPWLLIKEKDSFARPSKEFNVVGELPESVKQPTLAFDLLPEAVLAELPKSLAPQLATLFDGMRPDPSDWIYEIKFDGYRIMVRNDASGGRFFTRSGLDWTSKLLGLKSVFDDMKLPLGWYDGELTFPNERGLPDFGALQQAFEKKLTSHVILYLFDLPYVLGHDLRAAPLQARRNLLERLLSATRSDQVRFSESFDATPESLVTSACKMGLEGIIAKRRNSTYRSTRSEDWIKLKCAQRQEFVIGGYTTPRGTRSDFGALLLGVHDSKGDLQYAGSVGTGFSQKALHEIKKLLKLRARASSPFSIPVQIAGQVQWVAPTMVAEVSFADWTRAGRVRHAVFRGLRDDKDASSVVREQAQASPLPMESNKPVSMGSSSSSKRIHVTNSERVIDVSTGTTT